MDPNQKTNIVIPEMVIDEDETQDQQAKFLENFIDRNKLSFETLLNLQINKIRMAFNKGKIDEVVRCIDCFEMMLSHELKDNEEYKEKKRNLNKKYRGLSDIQGLESKYKMKFILLLSMIKHFLPPDIITDYVS